MLWGALLALGWSLSGCGPCAPPPAPAGPWPGDRGGLAFAYDENPARVFALGPDGRPVGQYAVSPTGLLSRGMALLDRDNVMRLTKGSYEAQAVGGPVAAALDRAGAFTIEACITPVSPAGRDAGTIVSLEPTGRGRGTALALVQTGRRLGLTLGPARGKRRTMDLCEIDAGATCHIVVTCSQGLLTCYRNGRRVARSDEAVPTFKAAGAYRLVFGDTYGGDSDWRGRLAGVALYARQLSAAEVQHNYRARLARARKRPAVPVLKVRVTLLAHSDWPRPGSNPYYRALAICHYRVDKVIEGAYDGREIVVAHWARWRNSLLPFSRTPLGQRFDLVLEPFDRAGTRVTRAALSFTLGAETFDLPWYYDAGLTSLTCE